MKRILISLVVAAVQIVLQVAVTVWAVKKAYAMGHMDGWDTAARFMRGVKAEAYPEFCGGEEDERLDQR